MTKKTESKKKTINDFKPKEHKLDIKHPVTGKDIGGWLTIVGSYSKEFYQAAKNVLRNKDLVEVDFEVTEEENSKTIAACIVGWDDDFFQQEFSQEGASRYQVFVTQKSSVLLLCHNHLIQSPSSLGWICIKCSYHQLSTMH